MAAPTFRAAGAKTTGAGGAVLTVAAPTGVATGDLEILIASRDVNTAFTLAAGGSAWTALGELIGNAGAEHVSMWWRVRQAGDTNPQLTVAAGAQHGIAARLAITAGTFDEDSPIEIFNWTYNTTASAAFSYATSATLGPDRLVFGFCSSAFDSNTHQVPVMTNAALTGLTAVLTNHQTNVGDGGGFGATCGVKAVAGNAGTFACTLGTSALQVKVYFAIKPVVTGPKTLYGAVSMPVTFGKAIAGRRTTFSSIDRPFTFSSFVDGNVVIPAVTHYGNLSMPMAFNASINGSRKTFGQVSLPLTFSKDIQGRKQTFGKIDSPFTFGKAVSGSRKTFGQVSLPLSVGISTAGFRVGNTLYGAVSLPITFGKDIRGQRKTFGQLALPITFGKDVKGVRKTFGKIDFPIIFTKDVGGRNHLYGQLSMQTIFGKETAGRRKTFSQVSMPIVFSKSVAGRRKTFGQVALPIIFAKEVAGTKKTFGQITSPFVFGATTNGARTAFGRLEFPMNFNIEVKSGPVKTYSKILLPIIFDAKTAGRIIETGIILNSADSVYLGTQLVSVVYAGPDQVWPELFKPTHLVGLEIWLDASKLGLVDGVNVNGWPDLSGNNRHMIVSEAYATPPSYKTNGLNGKGVIRFSGGEALTTPAEKSGFYNHFFVVARYDHATFPDYDGLLTGWQGNDLILVGDGSGLSTWYPTVGTEWVYHYNGINATATRLAPMQVWAYMGISRVIPWNIQVQVGLDRMFPPRHWEGEVAEVLGYNRVLSTEERQQVETYLRDKWGI